MTKKEITNFDTIRKEKLIENIRQCSSIYNNCDYLLDHNDCDDLIEYIYNLQHQLKIRDKTIKEIIDFITKKYYEKNTIPIENIVESDDPLIKIFRILLKMMEKEKNE